MRRDKKNAEILDDLITAAIQEGARTVEAVKEYVYDNGWSAPLSRQYIEAEFRRRGLVYVQGWRWEKPE